MDQKQEFKVDIQWVVPNFSQKPVAIRIKSPKFPSGCDLFDWSLRLLPKTNKDKVAVFLCFTPNSQSGYSSFEVRTQCEITLLDANRRVLSCKDLGKHRFSTDGSRVDGNHSFLRYNRLVQSGKLLPSNELHVHGKIVYKFQHFSIKGDFNTVALVSSGTVAEGSLTKRFQHLFNQEMPFADVQIHSGEAIFPAHKVVLAAGSPVFSAMLQSEGFSEKKTNILKIDDLEPSVVKEMLRFLYTDRVEKMNQLAKALFVAADKYLIDLLKSQCQTFLVGTVTEENCCELLLFSEHHSAAVEFKKIVMDYIVQHSSYVCKTEGIKELKQFNPLVAFQVLDAVMAKTVARTESDDDSSGDDEYEDCSTSD